MCRYKVPPTTHRDTLSHNLYHHETPVLILLQTPMIYSLQGKVEQPDVLQHDGITNSETGRKASHIMSEVNRQSILQKLSDTKGNTMQKMTRTCQSVFLLHTVRLFICSPSLEISTIDYIHLLSFLYRLCREREQRIHMQGTVSILYTKIDNISYTMKTCNTIDVAV